MWRRKGKGLPPNATTPGTDNNNSPDPVTADVSPAPQTDSLPTPLDDQNKAPTEAGGLSKSDRRTSVSRPLQTENNEAALAEEYERKIRVLSQCLEEKAEENITLYEQIRKNERRILHCEKEAESAKDLGLVVSELNSMLRQKDEEYELLKEESQQRDKERSELQRLNEEFERRIRVLSTCLEEMAQENMNYYATSSCPPTDKSKPPAPVNIEAIVPSVDELLNKPESSTVEPNTMEAKLLELTLKQDLERAVKERNELEAQILRYKEDLDQAESKLQAKEKRIVQLNTKLMDAVNKKTAFQESNDLYEQKLKSLEKELMENLHQEGIRRQEAEYLATKLKKKVAELQFLLDERDQESDSSYYSEDDDFD